MISIEYKFKTFKALKNTADSSYIFQKVKNRELSKIYHSHDFYEWFIILEGHCSHIINEREAYLEKNTCLLLCPGDRHKFTGQSEDLNLIGLSVKKEEMDGFLRVFGIKQEPAGFQITLNATQAKTLLNFYYANNESEYKLLLANLIKLYIDASAENAAVPASLKFAVEEMKNTENLRCGVEKFVELSQYSKTHLNRLMKKHYNTTIHDYIVNTRLEAAYTALMLTNIHMEDLAESIGYASFSHFNKIFKSKYGMTPAELRKKHNLWTT